jgi:hypothetical protein
MKHSTELHAFQPDILSTLLFPQAFNLLHLSTILSIISNLPSSVVSQAPPITEGLIAHYNVDSWSGTQWLDLSAYGNHVTDVGGTVISVARTLGAPAYIYGASTAWMRFPKGVLPSENYTLFFVARYNGESRNRIFQGVGSNWLSGFWNNKSGLAFHGKCPPPPCCLWITPSATDMHGNDWVVGTDLSDCFRSNGVNRTIKSTQCSAFDRLSINNGSLPLEVSDFAVQCVLVYNRKLSIADVVRVESWLTAASLGPWSTASLTTPRYALAAASLPQIGLAIFAGGTSTSCNILERYQDALYLVA